MKQLQDGHADAWLAKLGSTRGLWAICTVVMVLCVLARLPFLVAPGLSIDSYTNLDGWPSLERFASQGRFGQYLLFHGLEAIGVDPETFATLFQAFGVLAFAFCAPLFFTAFSKRLLDNRLGIILASLLLVLHPFQAEILTFSEASFTALLAVAMGIASIYIVARFPRRWWVGVALLVFALSLYQLVLNYVCLMVMLGALQVHVEGHGPLRDRWQAYRPVLAAAVTVIAGLVTYLVINKALLVALDVPLVGRGQTLAFDQLGQRWLDIKSFCGWLLPHPLFLAPGKAIALIFWAFVLVGWCLGLAQVVRRWKQESPVAVLIILAMPVAGLGVVLAGATWWPAPRVLGGVVVLFAIGCYWLFASDRQTWVKVLAGTVAGIILLASIAIGHRIHSDQRLLNTHDGFLAEQIYSAVRSRAEFTEQTPVAIVNNTLKWSHPASLRTTWMDMNISAFSVPSAARARIALSTGRLLNIRQATDEEAATCTRAATWPDAGFVHSAADGGVLVCL